MIIDVESFKKLNRDELEQLTKNLAVKCETYERNQKKEEVDVKPKPKKKTISNDAKATQEATEAFREHLKNWRG